jgi:hypothetical protein
MHKDGKRPDYVPSKDKVKTNPYMIEAYQQASAEEMIMNNISKPIVYKSSAIEINTPVNQNRCNQLLSQSVNHYHSLKAVDLGLSVLWANCNMGAKLPRDYGAHIAWGDPTGRLWSGQGINWKNDAYTWNTTNYGGNNPPDDIGGSDLDVVAFNWSDGWRMPSYSEAKELCEQCEWKLQTYGDIKWFEVIGPNGNSIIMPLAGIYGDDLSATPRFHRGPLGTNEMGSYWTSTSCPTPSTAEERGYGVNEGVITAWSFRFFANSENDSARLYFIDYVRGYHMSIRPVQNK